MNLVLILCAYCYVLYRDDYYNPDSEEKNITAIIAKQRSGSTGTVKLLWLGSFTRFEIMNNIEMNINLF